MDLDAGQSVELLGQGELVLILLELGAELSDKLRRDKRADLLETVVALLGQLEEVVRGHPFFTGKGEFNG